MKRPSAISVNNILIKKLNRCFSILILPFLIFVSASTELRADQTVTVRSGNGTSGLQDTQVRVFRYGRQGDITPTAADFVAAQTAQFAWIEPGCCGYVFPLPSDPTAQWIGTTPGFNPESALYAIPFQITDQVIVSATLDLPYAVDNAINGVFINGTRISGNSFDGDYHSEFRFVRSDIGPLLRPNATNWLYLNVSDYGGIAALIFRAKITTQGGGTQSVTPDHGGNVGSVTTSILHPLFQTGAIARLTGGFQSDIIGQFTNIIDLDNTKQLVTTFDLTGATPGLRDITITQPDGTVITLNAAFTVQQGGSAQLSLNVLGPSRVRLGRQATFEALVRNDGNVDANFVVLGLSAPGLQAGSAIAQASDPFVMAGFGAIPPGGIGSVTGTLGLNLPGCIPATGSESEGDRRATCQLLQQLSETLLNDINTIKNIAIPGIDRQLAAGNCFSFPTSGNCPDLFRRRRDLLQQIADLRRRRGGICRQLEQYCGIACEPESASSSPIISPSTTVAVRNSSVSTASTLSSQSNISVCAVTSVDPNDKVGLEGVGAAHYLRAAVPLPYTILFENLATATAPAAQVVVTDQLDPNLDPATFSLQSIRFGNTAVSLPQTLGNISTFVDLRPQQNLLVEIDAVIVQDLVTVTFSSIDPDTGLPPSDPTAGFLPPNKNTPEGEGSLFFVVSPKKGLATGTQIRNRAVITFDNNAPISTPVWSNTIDNSEPISSVSSLSLSQISYNFNVQWSGIDVGSGIQDFSIYVSDNGGPFTPWLTQTAATQATYAGLGGHTYSFYSIARDLVGNLENLKTSAEASTRVVVDTTPAVIVPRISGTSGNNGWYQSDVTVNWSVTDPESGITSSSGCNATTLTADTAGITLTCSAKNGAGLSSSVPITIKVDKSAPVISGLPVRGCAIWPPNHKLVQVATVTAADALSGLAPGTFQVTGTSNEPSDPQIPQIVITPNALGGFGVQLQADRLGTGNGRAYTLTATAADLAGNSSTITATCNVPHDQGR